jgi:hypothetical protein
MSQGKPTMSDTSTQPLLDRPMRWAQLALVENDPRRFDMRFWLDYFKRVHAEGVCLSAGGCVAYYPTDVPLHHRCKWMGNSDPLGDLIRGCRALGMVVVARTDPHAARQEVLDAHPDWFAIDAQGKTRRHWAHPDYFVTCALGPYNFEFMTAVTREIVQRYMVDGVFCNRWDGSGMCYCEHCQERFRAETGHELPRTSDPADPARRDYITWRQTRLFALWDLWDAQIQAINPKARFIPNTGGGALSGLDMARVGEKATILVADRQARRGLMPPWANGKNGKEYRATAGDKPCIGLFSVGLEEPHRWKDSVQSPAEISIWVADGIAHGLRPWFTKFCGVLHDQRWLAPVERIFTWHHRHERYLRNQRSLARVGLIYSQQTAHYYGGERAHSMVEDHILGWYQALVEARIPFEMVHDRRLDAQSIEGMRLLILPNIAALSDAQCEQVRSFVGRGGSIIATHQTSLCDEWGIRRSDFGLADLLGVSFVADEGPMRNAYLRLEHERRHRVLDGLADAPRIIHGVRRIEVSPRIAFPDRPITLIPAYPDLPMEEVYPRIERTETPELYLRQTDGGGRVAYFNWDIDRTFWEVLSPDHGRIMANVVAWAADEPQPVELAGQGLIDLAAWRQPDSMTVHMVNLTNPMAMKGPYRELIPSPPQELLIRMPTGLAARRVQFLVSEQQPQVSREGQVLRVRVPPIADHEVVAVDLAQAG